MTKYLKIDQIILLGNVVSPKYFFALGIPFFVSNEQCAMKGPDKEQGWVESFRV